MNKTKRGGKREGAGRKPKGITKKVSLTLSEQLWDEINHFDGTVADYIRSLKDEKSNSIHHNIKHDGLKKVTKNNSCNDNEELTKKHVEQYWEIYKRDFLEEQLEENKVTDEAIANAYKSLFNVMFGTEETAQIETSMRYRSPFSNKWFSSIKNMLKVEVPGLISSAEVSLRRKKENAESICIMDKNLHHRLR